MIRLGGYLAVFGAAALVLPLMGYQLRFLRFMDEGTQQVLGIGLLVAGAACLAIGFRNRSAAAAAEPGAKGDASG